MKKVSLLLAIVSFAMPLAGCNSSKALASAVFNEYKSQLVLAVGSPDKVIFRDVYYAHITGNGKKDAGNLLGNIYFQIPYHVDFDYLVIKDYVTYAVYSSSENTLYGLSMSNGRPTYLAAVESIGDGTYKGKVGLL